MGRRWARDRAGTRTGAVGGTVRSWWTAASSPRHSSTRRRGCSARTAELLGLDLAEIDPSGLRKALAGRTTLEEVLRVTPPDPSIQRRARRSQADTAEEAARHGREAQPDVPSTVARIR
jgi:hypothetical protein